MVFLHKNNEWHAEKPDSFITSSYSLSRLSASREGLLHPFLGRFENAVLEGQAAARQALRLREKGFKPDVIVSHAGFGNGLYLKDIFPDARRIGFFEWYYSTDIGSDVNFLYALRGESVPLDRAMRLRTWNAVTLLELAQSDLLITPTEFQKQQFPDPFRSRINVVHEGIDFASFEQLHFNLPPRPSCLPQDPDIEVVTHVARGFELYRGFPQAIKALALLQKSRPKVHVLIAGVDQVCYGGSPNSPDGQSWGMWAKNSAGLDPERTHWLGALQTPEYQALLAHSKAHLYLTVPFVLSWSLLEAMATAAPLVCSDTEPVREVLEHGTEALLAPFDDPVALASALESCLQNPEAARGRAGRAQKRAETFDAQLGLEAWKRLLLRGGGTVSKA